MLGRPKDDKAERIESKNDEMTKKRLGRHYAEIYYDHSETSETRFEKKISSSRYGVFDLLPPHFLQRVCHGRSELYSCAARPGTELDCGHGKWTGGDQTVKRHFVRVVDSI